MKFILLLILIFVQSQANAFTLGSSTASATFKGWDSKELKFKLNISNCGISENDMNAAIDSAFNLWNSVDTSSIKLKRGDISTDTVQTIINNATASDPYIICDDSFDQTFGLTNEEANWISGIGSFNVINSKNINYGFLVLNSMQGSSAAVARLNAVDLSIVIAHEIGHVLGLGHTSDEGSLMYYSIGKKQELRLSLDDKTGLTYLNPRNEPVKNKALGCASVVGPLNDDDKNNFKKQFIFSMFLLLIIYIFYKYRISTNEK